MMLIGSDFRFQFCSIFKCRFYDTRRDQVEGRDQVLMMMAFSYFYNIWKTSTLVYRQKMKKAKKQCGLSSISGTDARLF